MSSSIQKACEVASSQDTINFPNIRAAELRKVIEYCDYHNKANHREVINDQDVKTFDSNFVKMDKQLLFAVVIAAHYLDIKPLLDLCWYNSLFLFTLLFHPSIFL